MKWLTFDIQREPGFRFNLIDLLLIVTLVAMSVVWGTAFPEQHLYLLPLYVGISFFLFCNVFRIGNRLEMPWYLTFVAIAGYGSTQSEFPWLLMLATCEPSKWALIGWRIWRGPYVGVFHRKYAPTRSRDDLQDD